jgi:hypothetical protein
MKNWIQRYHYIAAYDAARIPLPELRLIIEAAWHAVPDSYIEALLESWWRRCQAVIDARGDLQNISLESLNSINFD